MKTGPLLLMILAAGLSTNTASAIDGFDAAVSETLERMAFEKQGLAVFDADDTLWSGDVGESFYEWLVRERKLLNTDYRRDLIAEYRASEKVDPPGAFTSCVTQMAGLPERDVARWARELIETRFRDRVYEGQKALIATLRARGWDVWIVSASNRYLVEAGAALVGVDPTHVIGVAPVVRNGIIGSELASPIPWGPGKVSAIARKIRRRPDLVAGDSRGDLDMMRYCRGVVLLNIHPEKASQEFLRGIAARKGWLTQRFPVPPGAR